MCFPKKVCWNPFFIVFFGCALFGPSCQKREIWDTHPKKRKIFTDNWKAHFWVFFVFSCFFLFFVFFCFFLFFVVFCVSFGGFKGHVTRATSLGPKPSLFICFFCFFCCFLFSFWFLSFVCFNRKKPVFPLKGAFFGLFSVFLFLPSLTFFGLPLFCFFFSVSLFLLSFFLPSCLSPWAFFLFLVFVSFFIVLSSLLLFHE